MNVFETGRHLSFASVENDQMKGVDISISQKNDEKKGKFAVVLTRCSVARQFQGDPFNFSVQQNLE